MPETGLLGEEKNMRTLARVACTLVTPKPGSETERERVKEEASPRAVAVKEGVVVGMVYTARKCPLAKSRRSFSPCPLLPTCPEKKCLIVHDLLLLDFKFVSIRGDGGGF